MKHLFSILAALGLASTMAYFTFLIAPQRFVNRMFHPRYGWCGKCERTWDVVKDHSTPYRWSTPGKMSMLFGDGVEVSPEELIGTNVPPDLKEFLAKPQPTRSCFPLCENCWVSLKTPSARLPYYRRLWELWERLNPGNRDWPAIRQSVLDGN